MKRRAVDGTWLPQLLALCEQAQNKAATGILFLQGQNIPANVLGHHSGFVCRLWQGMSAELGPQAGRKEYSFQGIIFIFKSKIKIKKFFGGQENSHANAKKGWEIAL